MAFAVAPLREGGCRPSGDRGEYTRHPRLGGFTLVELVAVVAILALVAVLAVSRVAGMHARAKETTALSDMKSLHEAIDRYLADMDGLPRFCCVNPYLDRPEFDGYSTRTHILFKGTNVQFGAGTQWDADGLLPGGPAGLWDGERGWHGPYLSSTLARPWPAPDSRRDNDDQTFAERGFDARYGRTNEVALFDPWGSPYVVQLPDPVHFAALRGRSGVDRAATERWRWGYARIVSAGPNGRIDTPRDRTAGRISDGSADARRDDLVLFLNRADVYEDDD